MKLASLISLFVFNLLSPCIAKSQQDVGHREVPEQSLNPYPVVHLSNGVINVTVLLPNEKDGYYRGSRFDWSGMIAQVEYMGHTYFQKWENYTGTLDTLQLHNPNNPNHGTGNAEEFRLAPGSTNAQPGELFMKIGVGLLEKGSDKPYNFCRAIQNS